MKFSLKRALGGSLAVGAGLMTLGSLATFGAVSAGASVFLLVGFAALTYFGVRLVRSGPETTAYGFSGGGSGDDDEAFAALRRRRDRARKWLKARTPEAIKINAAADLLLAKKFTEAIAAYEAIAREHPGSAADCESQIGAAWFFLGDYPRAIEFYRSALAKGADRGMMADNIQEAEQALRAAKQ